MIFFSPDDIVHSRKFNRILDYFEVNNFFDATVNLSDNIQLEEIATQL